MGVAACVNLEHEYIVGLLERDLKIMQRYARYAKSYKKVDDQRESEFWLTAVGKIVVDIIGADNLQIDPEAKL
jgi:hypothetical protein